MTLEYPKTDLPDPGGDNPVLTVVVSIMDFIVMVFAALAVLAFIISGIIYITSSGNDDLMAKSKKSLIYSAIGLVIGALALIIVKLIPVILKNQTGSF
ncbi:MAG: hypothetical protein GF335_04345 [Candidatus Moranbacteria bacterium]|nr:hypothetical protein [Candidatus Moranbacteria bacterium]